MLRELAADVLLQSAVHLLPKADAPRSSTSVVVVKNKEVEHKSATSNHREKKGGGGNKTKQNNSNDVDDDDDDDSMLFFTRHDRTGSQAVDPGVSYVYRQLPWWCGDLRRFH